MHFSIPICCGNNQECFKCVLPSVPDFELCMLPLWFIVKQSTPQHWQRSLFVLSLFLCCTGEVKAMKRHLCLPHASLLAPSFFFQMTDNIQQTLHAAAAAAVMNERNEYFWVCTDTYLRGWASFTLRTNLTYDDEQRKYLSKVGWRAPLPLGVISEDAFSQPFT